MADGTPFHPVGLDRSKLTTLLEEYGLAGLLLTSPENVFYTTGYTTLPSAGNPILYTLRNRLPFFSHIDPDGRITLLCWGFSAEGVDFGADEIIGFNFKPGRFYKIEVERVGDPPSLPGDVTVYRHELVRVIKTSKREKDIYR